MRWTPLRGWAAGGHRHRPPWSPLALVGVWRVRVQVGIAGRVLLHPDEVEEATRLCPGLAEPEPGRLQLLHSDEDVLEAALPLVRCVRSMLALVELHEHAIVSELAQRLAGQRTVHRL